MEDLDLTLEQLETWKDVDLIAEVLAMQDELKKTRLRKAHTEIENQRLRKEISEEREISKRYYKSIEGYKYRLDQEVTARQEFHDAMVTAAQGRKDALAEISHLEKYNDEASKRLDDMEQEVEALRHDLARRDARIESLENECKIRASWQRESSAAITAIGNVLHKFACEPDEAVYEIRKIIEEETDD